MPDTLEVTIDLGGSGIKAWYDLQNSEQNIQDLILMQPHLARFPKEVVESEVGLNLGNKLPEDKAWLKKKANSSEVIVMGKLAKTLGASNPIHKVKYEDGIFRLLGVIGVIYQKHQLFDLKLKLKIFLLLPFSEYNLKEKFERNFLQLLKNIYFQDRKLDLEVDYFKCVPEGYGAIIYNVCKQSYSSETIKEKNFAVLMLGYRNSSYLYFENEGLVFGKTEDLGFCQIVDQVSKITLIQKNNLLLEILPLIPEDISFDNPLLLPLVSSDRPNNIKNELKNIAKNIKAARSKYWFLLQEWIDRIEP